MEPNPLPETVVCRPDKSMWGLIILLAVIAIPFFGWMIIAALHSPAGQSGGFWLLFGLMVTLVLGIPALLAALLLRGQVIADINGLRWRKSGGWTVVAWPEITDYYEKLLAGRSDSQSYIVEASGKRLILTTKSWSGTEELRALIELKAVSAKAKKWAVLGTRPDLDWPRDFDYNTSDNRAGVYIFSALVLLILFSLVGAIPKIASTFTQLGVAWGAASIGAVFLWLGPLTLFAMLPFNQVKDNRKRRKQSVTVRCNGLAFEEGATRVDASWSEIKDYCIAPDKGFSLGSRSVVTTNTGIFDFTSAIGEASVLQKIIADNAKVAKTTEWRSPEDDVLGVKASRWSSGCEGVGERIYHYRSRSLRAMLLFPTVLASMPVLLSPLASMGLTPKPNWGLDTLFCGLALWVWWRYSVARIQVDASGITQRAIFGPRRLRWEQVERFYISGSDAFKFGNVVGAGTRIRFWVGIADLEELKAEIARRAVNSRNRTWDEAKTTGEPNVVKWQ